MATLEIRSMTPAQIRELAKQRNIKKRDEESFIEFTKRVVAATTPDMSMGALDAAKTPQQLRDVGKRHGITQGRGETMHFLRERIRKAIEAEEPGPQVVPHEAAEALGESLEQAVDGVLGITLAASPELARFDDLHSTVPSAPSRPMVTFENGAKRSYTALPFELIPKAATDAIARRLKRGTETGHGRNDWRRGGEEFRKECIRHLYEHLARYVEHGNAFDSETDAIITNAAMLCHFEERKKYEGSEQDAFRNQETQATGKVDSKSGDSARTN